MREKFRALKSDTFLRHNAIFLTGGILTGFLNYLFYPILGRLLDPSYFGEVQTLFSILSHISIFFNVLGLVVVNILANKTSDSQASKAIGELEKFSTFISLGLFLLFVVGVIPLQHFFRFGSPWPLLGLGITILMSVPFAFRRAVLQGQKDFTAVSLVSILSALLKLAFAVALILLGFKTMGAVLALLFSSLFSFVYVIWKLKRDNSRYNWKGLSMSFPDISLIRPQLAYIGLVFIVSIIFTVQYSIDVLSVKHYFPAHEAGLYAGISTIANIIFFASGSIAGVLLVSIKTRSIKNRKFLKRSMILTLLTGGGALVIFSLLPKLVIRLMIGSPYVAYSHYLPSISLALFFVSVANLIFVYHLAQRQYVISIFSIVGMIITVVLMLANHGTIQAIINNVIMGSIVLTGSISIFNLYDSQHSRKLIS